MFETQISQNVCHFYSIIKNIKFTQKYSIIWLNIDIEFIEK